MEENTTSTMATYWLTETKFSKKFDSLIFFMFQHTNKKEIIG